MVKMGNKISSLAGDNTPTAVNLWQAAIKKDYKLVKSFLQSEDTSLEEVREIFIEGCSIGNIKLTELLLSPVNLCLNDTVDVISLGLIAASHRGHKEVVQLLLEKGAHVDLPAENGFSALMIASQIGHKGVVEALLEARAQMNLQSKDGDSALMLASHNGYEEIVGLLLEEGAQVDLQTPKGWSALMLASLNGHSNVVRKLLQKDAQVDLLRGEGG